MQSRPLGRTGIIVSEIGLSAHSLIDRRILERALELGCTFFDAADERVEALIREVAGRRAVIAGRGPQADVVWLDADAPEEGWRTARVKGAWVNDVAAGLRAIQRGAQALSVTFNILNQTVSRGALLDAAHRAGVGVVAREPLAGGLLAVADGSDRVRKLAFLRRDGRTMAQAAIQFVLADEYVSAAIPGARTVAQAEENLRAADQVPLDEHELETIFEVTAGCEN